MGFTGCDLNWTLVYWNGTSGFVTQQRLDLPISSIAKPLSSDSPRILANRAAFPPADLAASLSFLNRILRVPSPSRIVD